LTEGTDAVQAGTETGSVGSLWNDRARMEALR
jgi:hypothetical protein